MRIFKDFRFEAAHRLPSAPPGHKCRNMHGHSYRLRVCVSGRPDPASGWVMDFGEIKRLCQPLIDQLDHRVLNDNPELGETTAEHIAMWFWRKLKPAIPGLDHVELWETPNSGARYAGEDEPSSPRSA